jgi:hypothetical protein
VENGLSHSVDLLFALVFALPNINACDDFGPTLLNFEFAVLLANLFFLLKILSRSFLFLLILLGSPLCQLTAALGDPLVFVVPFSLLNFDRATLLSRSEVCSLSSSSRMRLVVSSYSKSLKSFSAGEE